MSTDDRIADLEASVGRLQQLVEHLLSRPPEALPPPPAIMPIQMFGSLGNIREWSGSDCVAAGSAEPTPLVKNPCGTLVRYNYQSQQWEELCGLKIGVLLDTLKYASTSGARFQVYNSGWGLEVPAEIIQVGGWMLHPGESVDAGSEGFAAMCDGWWYLVNAWCPVAGS